MKNLPDRLLLCNCRLCRSFFERFNRCIFPGSARIEKFLLDSRRLCARQNENSSNWLSQQYPRRLVLADCLYGVGSIVLFVRAVFRGILAPASLKRMWRRMLAVVLGVFRGILAPASLKPAALPRRGGRAGRVPGYSCPGLIEARRPADAA